MRKVYKNEETIISVGIGENEIGKELATVEDVKFSVCCGCGCLEVDVVYLVQEGYLMIIWDEAECDIDYLIVKTDKAIESVKNKAPIISIGA